MPACRERRPDSGSPSRSGPMPVRPVAEDTKPGHRATSRQFTHIESVICWFAAFNAADSIDSQFQTFFETGESGQLCDAK